MPASVELLATSLRDGLHLEAPSHIYQPAKMMLHQQKMNYQALKDLQLQLSSANQQLPAMSQQILASSQQQPSAGQGSQLYLKPCSSPLGCGYDPIIILGDGQRELAVTEGVLRLACTRAGCEYGWVHEHCFKSFQERLVKMMNNHFSSNTEKLNTFTSLTTCRCGRGHLYNPAQLPQGGVVSSAQLDTAVNRLRKFSCSSSGSSPPSSGSHTPPPSPPRDWLPHVSPPLSPPSSGSPPPRAVLNNGMVSEQNGEGMLIPCPKPLAPLHYGNIFSHRKDLSVLRTLPPRCRNQYSVRAADETQHGNDATRSSLLRYLTRAKITSLSCSVCSTSLPVYDEFPLIDGTLFLSPRAYHNGLPARCGDQAMRELIAGLDGGNKINHNDQLHLNAVCFDCMGCRGSSKGVRLSCRDCGVVWRGEHLVVGALYRWDVFGGSICCKGRMKCRGCGGLTQDSLPSTFSEAIQPKTCPQCATPDYHLLKPLQEIFVKS